MSPNRAAHADVPALISTLLAADPGRPRVTWYGPDHERVEFSAKTLNNWIAKTANLMVDELDLGPGTQLGLALPGHWRTVVWVLAGWSVGAEVVVLPDPKITSVDVLVTDRPSTPPAGVASSHLVAVALPALATRFGADLPTGAVDAATEVRLQPDVFGGGDEPADTDPAFSAGARTVTYAALLSEAAGRPTAIRLLTGAGPDRAIEAYLAPLAAGGSVVLHHNPAGLDAAALADLSGQEGITTVEA